MLHNYITTALRHFRKYKGHSFINLLGLTTGITCTLLITMWIADEMSIDKFHKNENRTYQLLRNMHLSSGEVLTTQSIPYPVGGVLATSYPEVESVAQIGWESEYLFRQGAQAFKEKGRHVSQNFFDVFSFELLAGDKKSALKDMHSVVISESLAIKYFGSPQLAPGQVIKINENQDFTVSAVVKNPGANSSLKFSWLIPAQEFISRNDWVDSWYNGSFSVVCTLKEGADVQAFAKKIEQEINVHTNNEADERLVAQKYSDRYLHSTFAQGISTGGRIDYVYVLSIVALFTLVIACVNFMNLATAQSARRAREIGMRKVMGARRIALSIQFLTESLVLSLAAVLVSVAICVVVLPFFNSLTGKSMIIDAAQPATWLIVVGITVFVGFLSGSYPAFALPAFHTIQAMKGAASHSASARLFRKGLVMFQFGVSVVLIVGTIAVYRQIDFIMTKNLGVDKSNVMMIGLEGELGSRFETYKAELLKIPGVESVTATSGNPLSYGRSSSSPTWEGKNPDEEVEINILMVDQAFVETMKATVLQGRNFSQDIPADTANYLVNEEAARIMGFTDAIGQRLTVWGIRGEIVGVVKNFHMSSLYEPIAPLIIRFDPANTGTALVRIDGDISETVAALGEMTSKFNPSFPFEYRFLDEEYAATYQSEQLVSLLVSVFAGMAVFISCLGLLGLCSFSAEQRKKELGIRKVHGASSFQLVTLMGSEYSVLVIGAFVLCAPLAWYLADEWLQRFTFRTSVGILEIALAGLGVFIIAGATIGFKSLQAATANPVDTLKEEG